MQNKAPNGTKSKAMNIKKTATNGKLCERSSLTVFNGGLSTITKE